MNTIIRIKVDDGAYLPTKGYYADAGIDLRCKNTYWVSAHSFETIDTGVHIQIDRGFAGLIVAKSGLNRKGLTATGLVDAEYTGTVEVVVHNKSDSDYYFERGEKVAQLVVIPIPEVAILYDPVLKEGERAANGFSSTGK